MTISQAGDVQWIHRVSIQRVKSELMKVSDAQYDGDYYPISSHLLASNLSLTCWAVATWPVLLTRLQWYCKEYCSNVQGFDNISHVTIFSKTQTSMFGFRFHKLRKFVSKYPSEHSFYLNSVLCHSCLHPWHPGNQHLKQLKWPNSKMLDAGNIETRTQSIYPCQIPAA